jgi:hypothetical protein
MTFIRWYWPLRLVLTAVYFGTTGVSHSSDVTFPDLYGHTIHMGYDAFGRYRSLDGTREWNFTSVGNVVLYIGEKGTIFERIDNKAGRGGGSNDTKRVDSVAALGKVIPDIHLPTGILHGNSFSFEGNSLIGILGRENSVDKVIMTFARDDGRLTCDVAIQPGIKGVGETRVLIRSNAGEVFERLWVNTYRRKCSVVEGNELTGP